MIGHCQYLQENFSQVAILILRQSRQEEQRKVKDKMSAAMPQCFETWSVSLMTYFLGKSRRLAFHIYLGRLLAESQGKKLTQRMFGNTEEYRKDQASLRSMSRIIAMWIKACEEAGKRS